METPQIFYIAANYCALCQERFPPQSLSDFDAWQSNIRAVLCLDKEDENRIEITEPFHLADIGDDIDVTLSSRPQSQTITISGDLPVYQMRRADRLAFCFHVWCHSIMMWKLDGCSTSLLYRLARTLLPDISRWQAVLGKHSRRNSTRKLEILASSEIQPTYLLKLPIELRTYIWRDVGLTTPYSAFIIVTTETSRLARHLCHPLSRDIILQQGSRLSANMVSVFGTQYIQKLIIGGDCGENAHFFANALGIRYITSYGGLCALQLFGFDWESGWIGSIPTGDGIWHGQTKGGVSTLRCDYNDINCTAISLAENVLGTDVLWDQPDFPTTLPDPNAALFDLDRDIAHSTDAAPKRRFFRYLSMYCKDEYAKALSVYVSACGIVGLEAHFNNTSRGTGDRTGCMLHFPLRPSEQIAYAWLRMFDPPSPAFPAPALVIQTTTGRIHTFGSYILPSLVVGNNYQWVPLQQKGCVAGFYYENVISGTTIIRLGVTGDDTPSRAPRLPPLYYNCGFPSPPIGTPNAGLFLSIAALSGLRRVDTCRTNKRCTGMLLHYLDGHTTVLGQWHASPHSQQSCIYDNSRSAITKCSFAVSKLKNRQIVTDVSFSSDIVETIADSNYEVFKAGDYIAWWFSERYDKILRWTGDLQRVSEENRMRNYW